MLRAAVVDVGGTLWPDRWPPTAAPLYAQRLEKEFGLSHEQVDRLLRELEHRDPARANPAQLTQNSRGMATDALQAASLVHISSDRLLQTMDLPAHGVIDLYSGAEKLLRKLKSLEMRCVIMSNSTFRISAGMRRDFHDLGVGHLIDEVISSVDTGLRKPHPRMFRFATASAGSMPEETVFIGDSEEKDIIPAKRLGMRAIRVAIEESPPDRTAADGIVTSLSEAANTVAGWWKATRS
jgi:HAD superfamily hydrolase (TIGR01509 family)